MQRSKRIANRGKKAFLRDQFKEIEENNRMGKIRIFIEMSRFFTLIQEN